MKQDTRRNESPSKGRPAELVSLPVAEAFETTTAAQRALAAQLAPDWELVQIVTDFANQD